MKTFNKHKLTKALPIIFSIAGSIGTVATSILASKETIKALKKIDEAKELKPDKKLTKIETVKAAVSSYIPAIVVGFATIASITSSTIISKKAEASMASACLLLEKTYHEYINKSKDIYGKDYLNNVTTEIAKDDYKECKNQLNTPKEKHICWESHIGFFTVNELEDIALAYGELNRHLNQGYIVTLKDWLDYCDGTPCDGTDIKTLSNIGWSIDYMDQCWEEIWVIQNWEDIKSEDGVVIRKIYFEEDPIIDPEEYEDNPYDDRPYDPDARAEQLLAPGDNVDDIQYPSQKTNEQIFTESKEIKY